MRDLVMTLIRRHRGLHYLLRNLAFAPAEWARSRGAGRCCAGRALPVVMIVGCGRSGTSFTARVLHSAGLLIPGEHVAPDEFNPDGFFEATRIVAINSDILCGSNGHWYAPPERLRVYSYQRARIVQALDWLCGFDGITGWKDPKAVLTLPVWLAAARELAVPVHVVGVFRNPVAVANSIVRHERGAVNFEQALNAWCASNARLLQAAVETPNNFSWFTIDQPPDRAETNLNAIAAKIGLPDRVAIDGARRFANADTAAARSPEPARGVYQRLLDAHAAQQVARPQLSRSAAF